MSTYQNLHWDSVNFLKNHLYRRLASPLNNILVRLALAEHTTNPTAAREQFRRIEHTLEMTLNLIKAWAALIHVQSGGTITASQRRLIEPEALPAWLVSYLNTQTAFRVEHTQPIFVHPESFYETLILMCQVGMTIGSLKHMSICDTKGTRHGIWVRTVFTPPPSGPYASLNALVSGLNRKNPDELEASVQLQVIGGFLKINEARFTLQNNTQSREQALTALLPAAQPAELSTAKKTPGDESIPAPSESPDQSPQYESSEDQQAESVDERAEQQPAEPILSGPVIAPTPRAAARLAITAPELASDPESRPDRPPEAPEQVPATGTLDQPKVAVAPEELPAPLLIPPPDFRQRLITPPAPSAPADTPPPSSNGSGDPVEGVASD